MDFIISFTEKFPDMITYLTGISMYQKLKINIKTSSSQNGNQMSHYFFMLSNGVKNSNLKQFL